MRSNSDDFPPGNRVKVIDGTFAGMFGEVVGFAEACTLWEKTGGERPPLKPAAGIVWVVLTVFGRRVPVSFAPSQLVS